MIIAISGICRDLSGYTCSAGSGKSRFARRLCEHYGCTEFTFAGPLRAATQAIFGFSDDEINGSSAARNMPVSRLGGITPRHAMNRLSERVRELYEDAFLERTVRDVEAWQNHIVPAVVSDVRLRSEFDRMRAHGAVMIRTCRNVDQIPISAELAASRFEAECATIADDEFDYVITHSSEPLDRYHAKIDACYLMARMDPHPSKEEPRGCGLTLLRERQHFWNEFHNYDTIPCVGWEDCSTNGVDDYEV